MTFKDIFPYVIIAVLMLILIQDNTKQNTITVGGETGKEIKYNPQPIIKWDTIYKYKDKVKVVEKVVMKENPINQELLKKYTEAKDSLEQLKLYQEAITERTYKETFKDKTQDITVTSEVQGTLLRQEIEYTIHPYQKEVKNPSQGLYLGAGIQVNHMRLSIPKPEVNMSYLNNKEMYTIGLGTEEIRINYKHKIF